MSPSATLSAVPAASAVGPRLAGAIRLVPGLLLSAAGAGLAMQSSRFGWLAAHGLNALTVAILLGIVLGNSLYARVAVMADPGVGFSKQTLLRAGVVLYGLRLTLHDIGQVGLAGVLIDALVLASTFGLAWLVGTRLMGLDRITAMLIGTGSAICGAAAILAAEPVVRGNAAQVTVSVASVVVFGTLAVFLYPLLYSMSLHWGFLPQGTRAFGMYAGSTIHEVAQVVAAGRSISADAGDTAVITKMVRVMMLAPFLVGLSALLARFARPHSSAARHAGMWRPRPTIPWFAFGFIAMVLLNSRPVLPAQLVGTAVSADTFLLAMAMAALGLTTRLSTIRQAGMRPLVLAALLFAWLVAGGATINRLVEIVFN